MCIRDSYNSTHVMGTTGGNTADMIESLELTAAKRIDPAVMVTHIGGLNAAAETTLNLPKIPGGKKLIYTPVSYTHLKAAQTFSAVFVSSRVEKISFSGIRPQSTSASSFSGILLRSRADTTLR